MPHPLVIHCPEVEAPEAFRQRVHDSLTSLQSQLGSFQHCRVAVERTHRRHHKGSGWCARIEAHLSGHLLSVTRDHSLADPFTAFDDSLLALRRQFEKQVQLRRGEVKLHAAPGPEVEADEPVFEPPASPA